MPTHKQTTGEWKTAGYLLIEMRREGQTPDAASYAAAMKVGTAGDGLVGCSVYRIHAQLLFTYLHTVTINHPHQTQACLEAGEKQRALGLWDEMVASGVRAPSKETLSLAMAAALDLRDWDRIDTLLALNSASVRVDQRFFSDMMAGFVQSGRWGSALNLLRVLGEGEGGADGSGGVSQRVTAGFYEQVRLVVVGWNGVVGLVIWLVWTHPFFLPLDPPPPPMTPTPNRPCTPAASRAPPTRPSARSTRWPSWDSPPPPSSTTSPWRPARARGCVVFFSPVVGVIDCLPYLPT